MLSVAGLVLEPSPNGLNELDGFGSARVGRWGGAEVDADAYCLVLLLTGVICVNAHRPRATRVKLETDSHVRRLYPSQSHRPQLK